MPQQTPKFDPVATGHGAVAVITAGVNMLKLFGVLHWTADQLGAVNVFVVATLTFGAALWTRQRVPS